MLVCFTTNWLRFKMFHSDLSWFIRCVSRPPLTGIKTRLRIVGFSVGLFGLNLDDILTKKERWFGREIRSKDSKGQVHFWDATSQMVGWFLKGPASRVFLQQPWLWNPIVIQTLLFAVVFRKYNKAVCQWYQINENTLLLPSLYERCAIAR